MGPGSAATEAASSAQSSPNGNPISFGPGDLRGAGEGSQEQGQGSPKPIPQGTGEGEPSLGLVDSSKPTSPNQPVTQKIGSTLSRSRSRSSHLRNRSRPSQLQEPPGTVTAALSDVKSEAETKMSLDSEGDRTCMMQIIIIMGHMSPTVFFPWMVRKMKTFRLDFGGFHVGHHCQHDGPQE